MGQRKTALVLSAIIFLSGCASGPGSTAMDRAITKCVLSIGAGAALGAVIGSQAGSAGKGAAIGGAVGAGACAIFIKLANDEDRARIRALEEQAIRQNQSRVQSFQSKDGSQVTVQTRVSEAPVPKSSANTEPEYTACRYSEQTVSLEGQSARVEPQLWCRLEPGDWQPVNP